MSIQSLALYGQVLFFTIVTIELSLVLLAAPAATAGAVCLDKARGTLDHMLATDLSNAEIVLGKLGVRLIPVLGLIVCLLPLSALTSLLGGIDPLALFGSFLTSVACAVLGCSLAMALSVWGRKTHEVLMVTYLLIIIWLSSPVLVMILAFALGGAAFFGATVRSRLGGVCQSVRPGLSAVYQTGKGWRVDLYWVCGLLFFCVRVAGVGGGLPGSSRRAQAGWAGVDPTAQQIRTRFLAAGLAASAAWPVA